MKYLLQLLSLAGILLTIVPSILFFNQSISHSELHSLMLIGTIIWFLSATFWLGRKKKPDKV